VRNATTTLVLGLLAIGLIAYVVLFDRGTLSSRELDQRKGSVLPQLVRARVDKIEIQRKGKTTVLSRDSAGEDEASLWQVKVPYQAKADPNAVDSLLSALEWIEPRRRLKNISGADRKQFGLAKPRYRLWFTVGKVRVPLLFGNETPQGDGLYAQAADATTVFVVGKDALEALDHDSEYYHGKELHDGVLLGTTKQIAFRDAEGERVVRKHDDRLWHLEKPAVGLASGQAVVEVVAALDALRAARFVATGVKNFSGYGMDRPNLDLTLDKTRLILPAPGEPRSSKPDAIKRENVALRLRFGDVCKNHPDERYLVVDAVDTVYCVLDADIAKLRRPIDALREPRLLPLSDDEVESVRIDADTAHLVLREDQGEFTYEAVRQSAGTLKGEARVDSVAQWLKALGSANAIRFDEEPLPTSDKGRLLTLQFDRGKDRAAYVVRVDTSRTGELRVQRADEPRSVVFGAEVAGLIEPSAARFRRLDLVHIGESEMRSIELRRGNEVERLTRASAQSNFVIEAPIHASADSLATGELTRLLSSLQAERFVADAPRPEYALSLPAAIVEIAYSDAAKPTITKRVSLRIGAETSGGRFAELEGKAGVFVANAQLAALALAPLISRTSLATPIERIRAIELALAGKTLRIERGAGGFVGATGTAISPLEARSLAERVATLRATRVTGYGPAGTEQGLATPFARILVEADAEQSGAPHRFVILIGAQAEDGTRFARRDDQQVGYLLSRDSLDGLLGPLTLSGHTSP
jgi:hypothetical protein